MDHFSAVLDALFTLLAVGGGGAAIAFAVFQWLGKSWLDDRFAKGIESLRHENAKELASLGVEIEGRLSSTIRVQEKEFEALSRSWHLLMRAFAIAESFVSPLQTYPDLDRTPPAARKEYIDSLEIPEFQKAEILSSTSPGSELIKALNRRRYIEARSAGTDLNDYISENEIFMSEDHAETFKRASTLIADAIIEKNLSREDGEHKMGRDAWEKLSKDCKPLLDELSRDLRGKFFNLRK